VALDAEARGLGAADRRLAHEIAAGVLRNRSELDRSIAPLVSDSWQRTPDDLKDLLRIGAHQVLRLSRVPRYAAVDTTVAVAKRAYGPRGARLINAVLRKLAGNAVGAAAAPRALSAQYSHPQWLVDRWLARFGAARTEMLLRHNNDRPELTIQPVRWSGARLRTALADQGVEHRNAAFGCGFVVEARRVTMLPGYAEGAFVVQDAGSARLLEHSAIPSGAIVWDACAAPGGKAAVLNTRCRVIASEFRRNRVPRLAETVRRAAPEVTLLAADARRAPLGDASVDVVLVDVPCSATGTMARHPDARWRITPARIRRLVRLQSRILDGVAPAVREGGLLAYITCSLEREENEDQVDRFLARHRNYARDGDDLLLVPGDVGTDGGYAACLRRL
jgi:16S rRNA (cytosine967-C5)-methyltransferase